LDNEIKGINVLQSYKNENAYKQSDLSLLEFISKQVSDEIKRKQTDDQIRTLTLSVEQSPVSIVITDLDGNIEYVNPSFIKTTGYTMDEAIGQNPRILKSGKSSEQIYKDLWDTISSGHEWRGEFLNKKKNNELYWESAVISPVINEKSEVKHYMAIKEDITEQKMLQQQLQQSQKMDSLGKLAGGVAHDFNNLLTVINGFSEIALTKIDDKESLYRDISSIHSAGKKAENLVRQLLSFSSLQTYQPEIININNIIKNLNKMMRRLISEDIIIDMNLAKELSLIQGNQGQFEQVLMNLIVNARDAINQKTKKSFEKKIEIITANIIIDEKEALKYHEGKHGQYVLLTIIDNGIGMSEEILSKIFEPFYTTKETGKGTGLGLATVYGIIKQNNGWINVSSVIGVGTTFKIFWPTTEEIEDYPDEINDSKENYLNGGDETILLVEDDGDVRELVQSALENYGYNVHAEVDGLKGIEFLKNSDIHIDLLITDIVMPNLNGKELAEQALNLQPDLCVLYTSGYTDDQLVTDGELETEINFLQKPYSIVILLKKVRKILDKI
jgi:PAS domain S-box-containing protein